MKAKANHSITTQDLVAEHQSLERPFLPLRVVTSDRMAAAFLAAVKFMGLGYSTGVSPAGLVRNNTERCWAVSWRHEVFLKEDIPQGPCQSRCNLVATLTAELFSEALFEAIDFVRSLYIAAVVSGTVSKLTSLDRSNLEGEIIVRAGMKATMRLGGSNEVLLASLPYALGACPSTADGFSRRMRGVHRAQSDLSRLSALEFHSIAQAAAGELLTIYRDAQSAQPFGPEECGARIAMIKAMLSAVSASTAAAICSFELSSTARIKGDVPLLQTAFATVLGLLTPQLRMRDDINSAVAAQNLATFERLVTEVQVCHHLRESVSIEKTFDAVFDPMLEALIGSGLTLNGNGSAEEKPHWTENGNGSRVPAKSPRYSQLLQQLTVETTNGSRASGAHGSGLGPREDELMLAELSVIEDPGDSALSEE